MVILVFTDSIYFIFCHPNCCAYLACRSTYFEIEGASTYFWSYQRYEMIQEFVDRPSVAPPFILIWYIVELLVGSSKRLIGLCPGFDDFESEDTDDPFCKFIFD